MLLSLCLRRRCPAASSSRCSLVAMIQTAGLHTAAPQSLQQASSRHAAASFSTRSTLPASSPSAPSHPRASSPPSSRTASAVSRHHLLTAETVNPRVRQAQYAVRGELVQRADAIKAEIEAASRAGRPCPFPFSSIIHCNIGNPQELGQKPLTFHRQVLSLAHYPPAIDALSSSSSSSSSSTAASVFAPDAVSRARQYVSAIHSTGQYTASQGLRQVREEVAAFISARDGFPADPELVFLTDGASTGVKHILSLLVRDADDAVLTPIPQYPLYSATLSLLGGTGVGYYLDEESGWSLRAEELRLALQQARDNGKHVRALVVINPGNPTGQVLDVEMMRDVVRFCASEGIVLLADEVYQENVYEEGRRFLSFRRVVRELDADVALVSLHSTSKGFLGECGQRGGYLELLNVADDVKQLIVKLASISLCSNSSGQLMTGLMVRPPAASDPSFPLYERERDDILASLRRRALVVAKALNECRNISCQPVQGAMYAFPRLHLPPAAVEEAKLRGKQADTFYCLQLLEQTGLVTVPGSGFGQREGHWHLRMTILPAESQLQDVLLRLREFNDGFMQKYSS